MPRSFGMLPEDGGGDSLFFFLASHAGGCGGLRLVMPTESMGVTLIYVGVGVGALGHPGSCGPLQPLYTVQHLTEGLPMITLAH